MKDLPAKWLVETVLLKMARAISPSVEIGPLSAPSLLVPVVALAQCITVRAVHFPSEGGAAQPMPGKRSTLGSHNAAAARWLMSQSNLSVLCRAAHPRSSSLDPHRC